MILVENVTMEIGKINITANASGSVTDNDNKVIMLEMTHIVLGKKIVRVMDAINHKDFF